MLISSFNKHIRAVGHYIEQPDIINKKAGTYAAVLSGAAVLGLWGWDVYKAQPEDKRKIAIRDTLVLGGTALATAAATKKLMVPFVKQGEIDAAREAVEEGVKALGERYSQPLKDLMLKETRSRKEYVRLIDGMAKEAQTKGLTKDAFKSDLQAVLPIDLEGSSFKESLGKMKSFFAVGGLSVLGGLGGGLAANAVNGGQNESSISMVKEGIFQFIANIALCAVGASIGLAVVNQKIVKGLLKKMGMAGNFMRTGIIGAGLSIGILGGGAAANYVGQRFVNPMCNKLQGQSAPQDGEKRKVEFWDAILHLDDLPTALALAGVAILEPFIPLFFGFSGYRTGIGYRNHHKPPCEKNAVAQSSVQPALPSVTSVSQPSVAPRSNVFEGFQRSRQPEPFAQPALVAGPAAG